MLITYLQIKPKSPIQRNSNNSGEDLILVVDTNVFIHELHFIKNVLNSHIKGEFKFYFFCFSMFDFDIFTSCLKNIYLSWF